MPKNTLYICTVCIEWNKCLSMTILLWKLKSTEMHTEAVTNMLKKKIISAAIARTDSFKEIKLQS